MRRLLAGVTTALVVGLVAATAPAAAQAQGEEVDGGPAAPQAAELESGTRYVDDVRPGEARWYAVEAGVAQGLRATLTEYGDVEYGCCLTMQLHDPDYNRLTSDNGSNNDGTSSSYSLSTQELDTAGTHYLEVQLDEDAAVRPVSYEFDLTVTGEAVVDEDATPTADASPTTAETDAAEGEGDPAAATDESDDSDGGVPTLLWVVVGLLVLLVLLLMALVVVLLVTNRRKPSTP